MPIAEQSCLKRLGFEGARPFCATINFMTLILPIIFIAIILGLFVDYNKQRQLEATTATEEKDSKQ